MSNMFCINKSGGQVPIYSTPEATTQIGTLYNREAFGYNRNWGGDDYYCNIIFRNSSGNVVWGFLVNPPSGTLTGCTDYPFGTHVEEGIAYYTFYMRNARSIYDINGNYLYLVPAGKHVACKTSLSGDSHPNWKAINYYQNSSGAWKKVDPDGAQYGFVDTGLIIASGYSSIPFYGSW